MPFPFVLPTTSYLSFQQNFTSSTHPSLPSAATTQRNVVRAALKSHKRLASTEKASQLHQLLAVIETYLKYLSTLGIALSGGTISEEEVELALIREVEVQWRPTLSSSSLPGRDADRVKGRGLDYEVFSIYHTYGVIQSLLARHALLRLYASALPTPDERTGLIQTATRHMKVACTIHTFLTNRANGVDGPPELPASAADVSAPNQLALQRLSQAEFNLLNALKDDPYPALLVQARNDLDRDWMIKAPEIPRTRAQILTRLCIGAAEHAAIASASLRDEKKVSKELIEYVDDVRRTARARACRFQAVDCESRNEVGKAISWVHAGLVELGFDLTTKEGNSKQSGLSKLKASWQEKREDKKMSRGSARWGSDAGKFEEGRILEYLEKKFVKSNNTVSFQKVPEYQPLLATLPSGMNMPLGEKWQQPVLSEEDLVQMRAPPDYEEQYQDSSGSEDEGVEDKSAPAGAFPGTDGHYKESYY